MWKSKALPGNHLSLTMAYQLWTAHHAALTILVSKQFSVEGETYVICSLKLSLSVDVLSSNNNLLLFVWRYLLLSLLLRLNMQSAFWSGALIGREMAIGEGSEWQGQGCVVCVILCHGMAIYIGCLNGYDHGYVKTRTSNFALNSVLPVPSLFLVLASVFLLFSCVFYWPIGATIHPLLSITLTTTVYSKMSLNDASLWIYGNWNV